MIEVENLHKHFGSKVAVDGVSFTVKKGEVLGFLGPNGAGKSTTMRMVTGYFRPTAGSISVGGVNMLEDPETAKRSIGYLPETPPLYRDLTVNEFLQLAGRLHRIPKKELAAAVDSARQRCGIADVGQRLIGALSKGYQQRVGIAQAIIHNPDVVILDEPTVGLDPNQIRDIRALIRELGGAHSVILSTHILPEVEQVCSRVQIIHKGQLVFADTLGAPATLLVIGLLLILLAIGLTRVRRGQAAAASTVRSTVEDGERHGLDGCAAGRRARAPREGHEHAE
jgi:ABC-2 type transport system ATP-binding protein